MAMIDIYNTECKKVGTINLLEKIFNIEVKPYILHEVILWQLAKRRQGDASTKNRHEVRGGGRKPWRQKGTGHARSGSRRNPLWKGGGVIFGPKPRSYYYTIPKKVKKIALRMALSDKLHENKLLVLRNFDLIKIKTKAFIEILKRFDIDKALIVTSGVNKTLDKSAHNVPMVKVLRIEGLNVYDILRYERLILLESVIVKIEEALS